LGAGFRRLAAIRAGEPDLAMEVHVLANDPLRGLVLLSGDENAHGAQVSQVHGESEVILLGEDLGIHPCRPEVVPDELRHDVVRGGVDLRPPLNERHGSVPAAQRIAPRLLLALLADGVPADRARGDRRPLRMRRAETFLFHPRPPRPRPREEAFGIDRTIGAGALPQSSTPAPFSLVCAHCAGATAERRPRPPVQLRAWYLKPAGSPLTSISASNDTACSASGADTVISCVPTVCPSLPTMDISIVTGVPAASFAFWSSPETLTFPSPGVMTRSLTSKGRFSCSRSTSSALARHSSLLAASWTARSPWPRYAWASSNRAFRLYGSTARSFSARFSSSAYSAPRSAYSAPRSVAAFTCSSPLAAWRRSSSASPCR